MSVYVCKTLFKHASLNNYLQLFSTRGVTQIKYIEYLYWLMLFFLHFIKS